MAIMNLVVIAQFFEATYTGIFKRFFILVSTKNGIFEPVLTYFGILETNG